MSKTIEVKGVQEAQRALKEIAEGMDGLSEELLGRIGKETLELVKARTPVKTGRLAAGHKTRMETEKSILFSNDVEYAGIVEYGSSTQEPQPHWRPALEVAKRRFVESCIREGRQLVDNIVAKNQPR